MDSFLSFLQPDKLPVDFVIILLVLLAGQFQKKYLCDAPLSAAWKTLIVSFVFTFIYALLIAFSGTFTKDLPLRWFFSYVLATSLYELLFKKWFKHFFGDDDDEKTPADKPVNPTKPL